MWKIFVCLIVLGLVWGNARGQGTVILSGTIKLTDGAMCLQINGASVAADNCVEVVVVDTATANQYLIQKLDGTRADNELTLASGGNSFGTGGTPVSFYSGSANLNTVADLTNADAAFIIRLASETGNAGDCLKADGTYTTGGSCAAANDLWYFEIVSCTIAGCGTCNADVLLCDTCDANKVTNDAGTACEDCNVALHAECTACNQNSGTRTCTACNAGFITDATDGCTACESGQISANDACTTCDSGQTSHSDRAQCVDSCTVDNCLYCDSAPETCNQCDSKHGLDNDACTACADNQIVSSNTCTDCADNQTPNSAGDACVAACTDTNCQYCDSGPDTCDECNNGYTASDGACVEDQDTTTASTASDMIPFTSVLILAVLTERLMA